MSACKLNRPLEAFKVRTVKLEDEKKEVTEFISDTYEEAKSQGFDVAVLRKLIAQRKKDAAKLSEEEEILDLYKHALGMHGEAA